MNAVCLSVRDIKKDYEQAPLLKGISFDLHESETLCLLGPSGSGKSTLLRIIAGLETSDAGKILWKETDINTVAVDKRNFGLMFQDYALFPHMTVAENIAFGPRMRGWATARIEERVAETLAIVKLSEFAERSVVDLSGGEQQRVALARAIAPEPELLMLDEPLGALDKALRESLGQELRSILKEVHIPTIYVTHDQEEAFTIGDQVAVLNFGDILQKGTPEEIHSRPASLWIAGFLGFTNQLPGKVSSLDPVCIETSLGLFTPAGEGQSAKIGQEGVLVVKPDGVQETSEQQQKNQISGKIQDSQFRGDGYRLSLHAAANAILNFHDKSRRVIGDSIKLSVDPQALLWYPTHE